MNDGSFSKRGSLHFDLLGAFKIEHERHRSRPLREAQINNVYRGKSTKLPFDLLISDESGFKRNCHYVGDDWIASFTFQYSTGDEPRISRLHLRGNKTAAEEALTHAFLSC